MYINWKIGKFWFISEMIGGKIMKQAGKRICVIMLSLLMSISMLVPMVTSVQAQEGYATFTLSIQDSDYSVIFQCIDEKGNPLICSDQSTITMRKNEVFVINAIVQPINRYEFVEAEDTFTLSPIDALRYDADSSMLQYRPKSNAAWSTWPNSPNAPYTKTVLLKYQPYTLTDLPTIEGEDTTQEGITMHLFNYNAVKSGTENNINYDHAFRFMNSDIQIIDSRDWNKNGGLRQGLVGTTLQNGYPALTVENKESLAYLFDPAIPHSGKEVYTDVNKLLRKTSDGSYVFDSKENFAMFDLYENSFVLSTAVGAPNQKGAAFEKGNFLPFDTIRTSNPTKLVNGNLLYTLKNPDFHFGMTMEASFLQPKDGMYRDSNMVFDFSGDDDVWVFIDDVLVLDLGGIHPAQTGSIDFASGNVIVNGAQSTTIKESFEKAGVSSSFEGNTFADFTEHSIKFFYLERGAGASNCKLKINLPIMPKDGFAVSKDVSNVNEAAATHDTYTFRAYVDTNNDTNFSEDELLKNTNYQIGNRTYQTNADGTFTLKAGELAEFKEAWTNGLSYMVEEINLDATRYQDVTISSNGEAVGNYDKENGIASSGSLAIGTNMMVSFNNVLHDALTSSLQIQKLVSEGTTEDVFQMVAKVDGVLYEGAYTLKDGEATRSEIAKDGILTLKQNEIAQIEKLPIGTSFEIVESLDEVNADYQKYSTEIVYAFHEADGYGVANPLIKDGIVTGEMTNKTTLLHVTNTPIFGNLQIVKNINTANFANGDPIFTFQIDRLDKKGNVLNTQYHNVRFDNTLEAQTILIEHLPLGEYQVTELSSLRYEAVGEASKKETIKKENQTILFGFTNKVVFNQYYSHTDIVENYVEYQKDEQGNITNVILTQNHLEKGQE